MADYVRLGRRNQLAGITGLFFAVLSVSHSPELSELYKPSKKVKEGLIIKTRIRKWAVAVVTVLED